MPTPHRNSLTAGFPLPPPPLTMNLKRLSWLAAWRQVTGSVTLDRLEHAFDEMATKYPVSPPQDLLERVRKHSAYVAHLMDARMTLGEQRRLYIVGGWFQLLGATLHIDLNQEHAATARLQTAASLAQHAEHPEIQAWCYETDAWRVLTDGEYGRALELSQDRKSVV